MTESIEALPVEEHVLGVLVEQYGWVPEFSLKEKLPNGCPRGKDLDEALKALERDGRITVRRRDGMSPLFRIPETSEGADTPEPAAPTTVPVLTPKEAQGQIGRFKRGRYRLKNSVDTGSSTPPPRPNFAGEI